MFGVTVILCSALCNVFLLPKISKKSLAIFAERGIIGGIDGHKTPIKRKMMNFNPAQYTMDELCDFIQENNIYHLIDLDLTDLEKRISRQDLINAITKHFQVNPCGA